MQVPELNPDDAESYSLPSLLSVKLAGLLALQRFRGPQNVATPLAEVFLRAWFHEIRCMAKFR